MYVPSYLFYEVIGDPEFGAHPGLSIKGNLDLDVFVACVRSRAYEAEAIMENHSVFTSIL